MKNHMILFDEPEESLHSSWQTHLMPILRRCIKSNNCQFILATHPPKLFLLYTKTKYLFFRDEQENVKVGNCFNPADMYIHTH